MGEQVKRSRITAGKKRRQRAFLEAFSKSANVLLACRAIGISRTTHYDWLKDDEDYADRFKVAEEDAIELLEREAWRRAHDGLIRKKFTKDGDPIIDPETEQQYVEREYSDTLLIFLLKGRKPERYRERYEHSLGEGTARSLADLMRRASNG